LITTLVVPVLGSSLCRANAFQAEQKQEAREEKAVPDLTLTDIRFSFKRDPRVVDSYHGLGPWVSGSSYSGATAQDTVETRCEGVDAAGTPVKISPEWIPSDPEMVTVSPNQSDHVTIKVHRAGESKLRITAHGFSKELVVRAQYVGKFIVLQIDPAPVKPARAAATEEGDGFSSGKERISYALGMNLVQDLKKQSVEVDADLVSQGLKDALAGSKTRMSEEQAEKTLMALQTGLNKLQAELQKRQREDLAVTNKKQGDAFLAENKLKEGVVSLPNGLQYKILRPGNGSVPKAEDVVTCKYRGTFIDGKQFDRGGPVSFQLGVVIKGWAEALQRMPAGSKWQLFVPPDLAYGSKGVPRTQIGPESTLIFELELLSIQGASGGHSSATPTITSTNAHEAGKSESGRTNP
jgi:FKBP-type peptidyl-prolyl cis-trans isomerase FklB